MLKNMMGGALLLGLMVVAIPANAEILVNHHGHSFEEFQTRQAAHHRVSHRPVHHASQHHYRSYEQHSKVVVRCFGNKNGQHRRVC